MDRETENFVYTDTLWIDTEGFTNAPYVPGENSEPGMIGVPGDVNDDGAVTLKDAQMILKAALRILSLSDESLADVNGDNKVTLAYAQLVLKAALGIIDL